MKSSSIPTLQDVARRAQVSTATVSRCLNAPERVSEKTRERVMEAVRSLGYSPNFGAQALAAKRTNTMGAVIPTMENAIFASGLQAFQETLREKGVTLLVASSSYRPDIEEEQIRALVARGADGLLLIGARRDPEIYQFLARRGVPVVIAWSYDPAAPAPCVGFDNRAAMKALTQAVLAHGHRRLGVISAPTALNDRADDRVSGVRAALTEAGLDPDALAVIETPYGIDTGADAFRTLMKRDSRPTGVMCGNDVLAVGALKAAKQLGMRVPEDVSITGFDDIELARVAEPPLTTVHAPLRRMGAEAARIALAMARGESAPTGLQLTTELRLRGTLGPAPQ